MRIRTENSTQQSAQMTPTDSDTTSEPIIHADAHAKSSDLHRIGGNILSLGTGEVVARIAAFFGTAYAARMLGPEQFGIVGFALAITSYFTIAVAGGFNDVGSREVARRPADAPSLAANVVVIRLLIAFTALVVLVVTAWLLNKPPTVKLVLLLVGLSFFPLAFDVSWVYKGLERNRRVALSLIVGQLLYTGAIFLAVNAPNDVVFVPLAQLLGDVCAALILLWPIFHFGKIKLNLREGLEIFRNSSFWAASRFLRTLMYTFDVVLIGFLLGEQAVGLYSAPYRICFMLVAVAVTIYTSYLPALTRAFNADPTLAEAGEIASRSINLSTAIVAPLVVGGIITSTPLLVTIFGNEYADGAAAFRFLILSIFFVFLMGTIHNILLVANRLKTEMLIFAFAAAVNVALNIIVIPRYGITGAAAVTATAEALTLIAGIVVVSRIGVPFNLRSFWRPLLASGIMGVVLVMLGANQSLFLYLAAGGASYIFALLLLRGIPVEAHPILKTIGSFLNLRQRFNL